MKATRLAPQISEAIRRALDEDVGPGDATSNSIIPPDAGMHGQIIAKQSGVIAGLVADSMGHTAPQFVLLGMAAGTLVSILLLRAFIVSTAARMRRERDATAGSEAEEHDQAIADRP